MSAGTGEFMDDLISDIDSIIHEHCGDDGESDGHNDWVADLANKIARNVAENQERDAKSAGIIVTPPKWVIVSRPAGNRTAYALVNTETWVQAGTINEEPLAGAIARILNQVGPAVLAAEMLAAANGEPF